MPTGIRSVGGRHLHSCEAAVRMQESSDVSARRGAYCGRVASATFFFNNTPTRIPDNTAARAAPNMAFMFAACPHHFCTTAGQGLVPA